MDAPVTTTPASRLSLLPTLSLPQWFGLNWPKQQYEANDGLVANFGPTVAVMKWRRQQLASDDGQQPMDTEAMDHTPDAPKSSLHPDGRPYEKTSHHTHHFIPTKMMVAQGLITQQMVEGILLGTMLPAWRAEALTELAVTHSHAEIAMAWMEAIYRRPGRGYRARGYDHASAFIACLAHTELFQEATDTAVTLSPQQFLLFTLKGVWVRPDDVCLGSDKMISFKDLPPACRTVAAQAEEPKPRRQWAPKIHQYYLHAILAALTLQAGRSVDLNQQAVEKAYFDKCLAKDQPKEFSYPTAANLQDLRDLYAPEHAAAAAADYIGGNSNSVLHDQKHTKDTLRVATFNVRGLQLHSASNAKFVEQLIGYMRDKEINALFLTEALIGAVGGSKLDPKKKKSLLEQRIKWRDNLSNYQQVHVQTSENEANGWLNPNRYEIVVLLSTGTHQLLVSKDKIKRCPSGRAISIPLGSTLAYPDGAINLTGVYGPAGTEDKEAELLFVTVLKWAREARLEPTLIRGDINVKLHDGDVENRNPRSAKDLLVQELLEQGNFRSALRATGRCRDPNHYSFHKIDGANHQRVPLSGSLVDHVLVPAHLMNNVMGVALRDISILRGPETDHQLLVVDYWEEGRSNITTHIQGLKLRPTLPSPPKDEREEFEARMSQRKELNSRIDMSIEFTESFFINTGPHTTTFSRSRNDQIEILSKNYEVLQADKVADIIDLWLTCTQSPQRRTEPIFVAPVNLSEDTVTPAGVLTMMDDILTETHAAFVALYQEVLAEHALAHQRSCRLTEKPRPEPSGPDEPSWNYLPGIQCHEIGRYIHAVQTAVLLTPLQNVASLRDRLVLRQEGTHKT